MKISPTFHKSPGLHYYLILCATLLSSQCLGFSTPTSRSVTDIHHIKSIIIDYGSNSGTRDATTIPIEKILSKSGNGNIPDVLNYATDFSPRQKVSISTYEKFTNEQHSDCIDLFDGYETNLIRCEILDETSLNVRWNATWIPPGSTWLYDLADLAGWSITKRSPDPAKISTFSWMSVFGTFQKAFATGNITLPVSCVEGNTILCVTNDNTGDKIISLDESIDLVLEADKNRLQNRKVAQELASWIDVSRRPPGTKQDDVDEWASIVRQRILTGVTGAGALDVDPNEDESEAGIALLIFGIVCIASLALSFEYFTMPEIVGGTGTIPSKCDDATILEFGSGYLSDCFGPYGDPIYSN